MNRSQATAVAIALAALFTGCTSNKTDPKTTVHNDKDNLMTMVKIQELTRDALVKVESDEELDGADKEKLRQALPLIRDMVAYNPTAYPPQVILGKTNMALGLSGDAEKAYLQACKVEPKNVDDQTRLLVASVYNDLSRISFNRKDYKQAEERANQTLIIAPDDPKFIANLASVQMQAGRYEAAKGTLKQALLKSPKEPGLLSLQKFLDSAQAASSGAKGKP